MTAPVTLWPAVTTVVPRAGVSVRVFFGPLPRGAFIVNPMESSGQGIPAIEELYVSYIGPCGLVANDTTFAIQPGQRWDVPAGTIGDVWVNARTAGHSFSAVAGQQPANFVPSTAIFPPSQPTSTLKVIPSYLYEEYADDEDLQAFIRAFNEMTQEYVDWFNQIDLSIYTSDTVYGMLLDWVAAGLYGMARPALPSGSNQNIGEYNTFTFSELSFNEEVFVGNQNYYATTDDVFKRILTWHLYKGDGKVFNIRWLKRRIMRFLFGTNGTSFNIDQTYLVSVSFGLNNQVNINVGVGTRTIDSGAIYNEFGFNEMAFDELNTTFVSSPSTPLALVLKAGIDSGVLELPFQFTYVVRVGNAE